jgi:hypothetical protein
LLCGVSTVVCRLNRGEEDEVLRLPTVSVLSVTVRSQSAMTGPHSIQGAGLFLAPRPDCPCRRQDAPAASLCITNGTGAGADPCSPPSGMTQSGRPEE